jgi:8-oxo-dGTP pyrophosphatase MutT (NUDIX family)
MLKHFTTSIFIINNLDRNFKILLIHHKKFDRWMVPGGHIEPFENQIEATIRETKEETGLDIKLFSFLHKKNEVNDSEWLLPPEYFFQQLIPSTPKEETHYHLDFAYLAFSNNLDFTLNSHETKDIKWVDLDDILNYNLFDGTRVIIKNIINKFESNEKLLFIQT